MTAFILYVSLCVQNACTITTAEFNTREACVAAQGELIEKYPPGVSLWTRCWPKG